ncbi:unnamed protein product [Phytophthora lilii]|uniref:Unnamed protein product n=1 Tax=Phytophthora lilii TaxID=2077276 RepID=A0A9W6X7I7_9STRA|nr:unnamed protein product [Phytophthora lilii]
MIESTAVKTALAANVVGQEVHSVSSYNLGQWIRDSSTDNALSLPSAELSNVQETAVVKLLDCMLKGANTAWKPAAVVRSQPPSPVKPFASIAAVSRSFTLMKNSITLSK